MITQNIHGKILEWGVKLSHAKIPRSNPWDIIKHIYFETPGWIREIIEGQTKEIPREDSLKKYVSKLEMGKMNQSCLEEPNHSTERMIRGSVLARVGSLNDWK